MILLIAYVVGFVWLWRYHVGYIIDNFTSDYRDLDGVDFGFSLFFGTMACFAWPVTLLGRVVFILWQKNMAENTGVLEILFPGPGEIETKQEKRQRIARSQQELIEKRQREINEHERANGIELTRWTA